MPRAIASGMGKRIYVAVNPTRSSLEPDMIRYAIACENDHRTESWFQSAAGFDRLLGAGMLQCPICGSADMRKALMAPAVSTAQDNTPENSPATAGALSSPPGPTEAALAELRRRIETESEYVGMSFAAEARAMHDGDAPNRAIHGEARADEARKLIEDGVPVAPLPFLPRRKAN